jgi:catechol 2,3-dioxygenase-like lactoylglutathione lyase family enzyme
MSELPLISGIQQIGIGNVSVYDTWEWYLTNLGMDVPVFDEAAEASLMLPYTGGQPRSRHAVLALNMKGGGGAEIWQYTSKVAQPPSFEILPGDLGIYMAKFKSPNVKRSYEILKLKNNVSELMEDEKGDLHFYLEDLYGNPIEIVKGIDWFAPGKNHCGGVSGAVIGVSDMDRSVSFYSTLLGYDQIVYDVSNDDGKYDFFEGQGSFRRVLLRHSKPRRGPFSQLLGSTEIELVQTLDRQPRKIFEDRMWGDLGYIHLCFDVVGMDEMRKKCQAFGHPFTVDSGDFDMGEASGHFTYIEDPDGALIEFVETQKVPIMKKLNWYLDLKKRDRSKPLPRWMLKAMGLNRVKRVPGN